MLKTLLPFFIFSTSIATAQIPDRDFEAWTTSAQNTYQEPSSGWWATLNPLANLGCPISVEKSADAYSGNYAARLETVEWGTLIIPGILASGSFEFSFGTDAIQQGQPFSHKPDKFMGYYKYFPVNNDSAVIYAGISRYNAVTQQREIIAEAAIAPNTTVNQYTFFELNFDYYLPDATPDSITIILSSSFDVESNSAFVGSVLYIDEISLDTDVGIFNLFQNQPENVFPNPARDFIIFEFDEIKEFKYLNIYDMAGKLMKSVNKRNSTSNYLNVTLDDLHSGLYIVQIIANNSTYTHQFIKR